MIWATWRMERSLYLVALVVLAVIAVLLALAGAHQLAVWTTYSNLHCSQPGASSRCLSAADNYYSASRFSSTGVVVGLLVPGLLGLVLGAPIVAKEFGASTNRLAWTQSITRTRWLVLKLAVGALATAALVAALTPVFQWWTGAVQRGDRIVSPNFDVSGLVPVAYAVFAFMLGALLGALVRRTGWAFALGVPLFAGFRFLEHSYLRSGLVPPVDASTGPILAGSNDWVLNQGFLPIEQSSPGLGVTWQSESAAMNSCTNPGGGGGKVSYSVHHCESVLKLHYVVQMQPGSHYWLLQLAEAAMFVAGACVLCALTVVAVRRWRT
ncbi:MAG: hypothetical protein ACRDZP_03890 [Acidimicrobiales bacterium]